MIRSVHIENFKSIEQLDLELGRVNVLIGENGSGKSNVLEAIVFASASAQHKLDNEFLSSRGIRVTEPRFMRSAFESHPAKEEIRLGIRGDNELEFNHILKNESDSTLFKWTNINNVASPSDVLAKLVQLAAILSKIEQQIEEGQVVADSIKNMATALSRTTNALISQSGFEFIIYSPENSALRTFQSEGQILPIGIKGEGLFAHLKALNTNCDKLAEIMEKLSLLDWFERLEIPEDLAPGERTIHIRDRYLAEGALFDQRSANEGFLFLLFYFTLFLSPDTPAFFAIDNIDASLNPKLCSTLVRELVDLAKKHDKQAIFTTHNPAVLDGLDLNDDEQRLFVVARNKHGHTKVRRVPAPQPVEGEPPMKLSEAFMRGYIGGLPKNF